jgi:hypothetical protein
MSLRCGCENEADDIVFGEPHRCSVDPKPPADLPRFVPSSWFVVPAETPEPLYRTVLADDELEG